MSFGYRNPFQTTECGGARQLRGFFAVVLFVFSRCFISLATSGGGANRLPTDSPPGGMALAFHAIEERQGLNRHGQSRRGRRRRNALLARALGMDGEGRSLAAAEYGWRGWYLYTPLLDALVEGGQNALGRGVLTSAYPTGGR